jgi:hypothetical protein
VRRLQRAYGYYIDAAMWDAAADLFTLDGSIELGLDGIYRGRERVREYLHALGQGRSGLLDGQLQECLQLQPLIMVAADGLSARARWRAFVLSGQLGREAFWSEGPYENEYRIENGCWQIGKLHWYQTFCVPYAGGWPRNADANGGVYVGQRLRADAEPSERYGTWPAVYTPPFHCLESRSDLAASPDAADASDLERHVQRLTAVRAVENLISAYGYYLDKQLWDSLAELFVEDATMEISQRGIYVGRQRIRAALELFGSQGIERGHLHNHLQLQPVIHVMPDGERAFCRSRAFSQLGSYEGNGIWHGGVYENEFVKQDGVWRFKQDHVYTTFFADYARGWKEGARAAAKVSDRIAPDLPPSEVYEAFPGVYVPPFHYRHPVIAGERSMLAQIATHAIPASLVRRIERLEDEQAIEILQRAYGYFVDKALWREAADLFAEDGTLEIGGRGVFVGKARVLEYLEWLAPEGLTRGRLFEHMQLQPIITLDPAGSSARGRWRFFAQVGIHQELAIWGLGTYENEYVKENGIWKIRVLHAYFRMYTPYEDGWGRTALPITQPEKDLPPDRPPTSTPAQYPSPFVPPFHFRHPVSGL